MAFSSSVLSLESRGRTATLWLDNEPRRNAFGEAFWEDLPRAMSLLGADPKVCAIVLAARGPVFSAGLDFSSLSTFAGADPGSQHGKAKRLFEGTRHAQHAITSVEQCPKPVIAVVNGWCIGGGVDLIVNCDIRLASADAKFSVRHTKLGFIPDVGALPQLTRVVSLGQAAELVYSAKDIDAARAERIGLVNEIYETRQEALEGAWALADQIGRNSPVAVQGAKWALRLAQNRSTADSLENIALWNAAFLPSDDLRVAAAALLEGRPPRFTGT